MKKILILSTIFLLLFVLAISINAKPCSNNDNKMKMCNKGDMQENEIMLLHFLNLTDKQIDKITKMRFDMRNKMIDYRTKKQKLNLELEQLFMEKNLNKKKILQKIEEIGKIKIQMNKLRMENKINVYNLLTDEQKEKLLQFKKMDMMPNMNCKMKSMH